MAYFLANRAASAGSFRACVRSQNVSKSFKKFQKVSKVSKCFKMFQNVSKCFEMFRKVTPPILTSERREGRIMAQRNTEPFQL